MIDKIKNKVKYSLFLKRVISKFRTSEDIRKFTCNICGRKSSATFKELIGRETISCYNCGATLRFRSIIAALSRYHSTITFLFR